MVFLLGFCVHIFLFLCRVPSALPPGDPKEENSCGAQECQECAARREIAKVLGPLPSPAAFP